MFFLSFLLNLLALTTISAFFYLQTTVDQNPWLGIVDHLLEIVLFLIVGWQAYRNKRALLEHKDKTEVIEAGMSQLDSDNQFLREEIKKILKR